MHVIEGNTVLGQDGICNPDKCDAWCCRHIAWRERAKDIDPTDIRWYKYHGVKVKRVIKDGQDMLHFLMKVDCEKLDPKTLRCTAYSTRPHSCRAYAKRPNDAFTSDNCGFYWRKLSPEEAKHVLRKRFG